jgi:formylglycine-generating enzyme required for sulfatase activity
MGKGKEWQGKRIDHSYAIASREVTVEQFLRFSKDRKEEHVYSRQCSPTPDCPMNSVTWYDAARYCNWLSAQEGIPDDEWCYLPNKDGEYAEGMKLAPDCVKRTGYRLPTQSEWEYACRAGSVACWSFGETSEMLGKYAWFSDNSLGRSHPAGALKPNDLGLFDMHGNAWEWCQGVWELEKGGRIEAAHGIQDTDEQLLCGGSFNEGPREVGAASRRRSVPTIRHSDVGFRPARTIR